MNEICVVSTDARYNALCDIFLENGYDCKSCTPTTVKKCDILILPIKSAFSDDEFFEIFKNVKKNTLVFSGEDGKVSKFFSGKIVNYAKDEQFLLKNAYITAECAVYLAFEALEKTLLDSKIAIIGYGRIGKYLSSVFKSLNSDVSVFARRKESREEALKIGCDAYEICDIASKKFDIIFNTVPEKIISKNQSDNISEDTVVFDLATLPGGFEDEKKPIRALALPGKLMPKSAGGAIFDFVVRYLSEERNP